MCDKCGKNKAICFHTSSCGSDISLCHECNETYEKFMQEAKERFFSEEIQVKCFDKALDYEDKFAISEIKKGDTIGCLDCGKPIKLDDKTFIFDFDAEYIFCPHCKSKIDVQMYHLKGKKL